MTKRLEVRLPDDVDEILSLYCQDSGASKTGSIVMLIKTLEKRLTPESRQLLANMRKKSAVN